MAIPLKEPNEIEKLHVANAAVAKALNYSRDNVKAGMASKEVDAMEEKFIRDLSAGPTFKGLYGFPSTICTSLNEVIIHGIPSDVVLEEGDILGLDIGTEVDGWHGDNAITMPIDKISKEDEALIACSKDSLYYTVDIIREGIRFKELSKKVEDFIVTRRYQPLARFCGHGIGEKPHEEPEIPNYLENGDTKSRPRIENGMVFCIEPMICCKDRSPAILKDGWGVISADGLRGSHYEHAVAVIDGRAVILSNSEN